MAGDEETVHLNFIKNSISLTKKDHLLDVLKSQSMLYPNPHPHHHHLGRALESWRGGEILILWWSLV